MKRFKSFGHKKYSVISEGWSKDNEECQSDVVFAPYLLADEVQTIVKDTVEPINKYIKVKPK